MSRTRKTSPRKREDLGKLLLAAIDRRDVNRVEEVLRAGVSPNTTDEHGTPALNWALYLNVAGEKPDERIALLLLESGAEPDKADSDKTTPIMLACRHGFTNVVNLLLRKGVNLSARSYGGVFSYGETPLSIAAGQGNRAIVRALIKAGADANQALQKGGNALTPAAASGDVTLVRELVRAGAKGTGSALFCPIKEKRLDIVTDLIAARAEVNIIDRWGNSVLGTAVQSGHRDIVELIIRSGAKLDAVSGGRTPLILAVCNQNAEIVDVLLRAGAKVDGRDIYKCTALMEAAYRPEAGILARLLAAGANPRLRKENGRTAMDSARDGGHVQNIRLLEAALRRSRSKWDA